MTGINSRTDSFGTYTPKHHHTSKPGINKINEEKLRKEVEKAKNQENLASTWATMKFNYRHVNKQVNDETDDFNRFVKNEGKSEGKDTFKPQITFVKHVKRLEKDIKDKKKIPKVLKIQKDMYVRKSKRCKINKKIPVNEFEEKKQKFIKKCTF